MRTPTVYTSSIGQDVRGILPARVLETSFPDTIRSRFRRLVLELPRGGGRVAYAGENCSIQGPLPRRVVNEPWASHAGRAPKQREQPHLSEMERLPQCYRS